MDLKKIAVRIWRCLGEVRDCGVNGRAVDGGLASDGPGSALGSLGVWALIDHRIVFPLPSAGSKDQKLRTKRKMPGITVRAANGYGPDHTNAGFLQD